MRKVRNNSLRVKRFFEKTSKNLKKINQETLEENKKQQQILLEKEAAATAAQEQKMMLASFDKMSYNEARKLASSLGISIYQRKKAEIIKDLKQHYEQLTSTHQLF
jgi:hypothetical protein